MREGKRGVIISPPEMCGIMVLLSRYAFQVKISESVEVGTTPTATETIEIKTGYPTVVVT